MPDEVPQGRKVLEMLEGLTLDDNWKIGARCEKAEDQTGGLFSEGYLVTSGSGEVAYLKAIDLFGAMDEDDIIEALNILTDGVRCEQELLRECRRMDRVVRALTFGNIREVRGVRLSIPVPYIIFEKADGNIRAVVKASERPSLQWCLNVLHHVATGLWQLHRQRIAHQDLKPSNALHFDGRKVVKIADLGRSVRQGRPVWYDRITWPGDNAYAPPEVAYGFAQTEFNSQRLASDMYLLGSFLCTLISGAPLNALLYDGLDPQFRPAMFGGQYSGTFENVIAHIQEAFEKVVGHIGECIDADERLRSEILMLLRQLADPDVRRRGHPLTRAANANSGNPFDLQRFLSSIPNLATRASGLTLNRPTA